MPARFALKPQLFARPAPEMHQTGLEGFRKRLAVHPAHHQDSAWRGRFAHDCGNQSIGGVLKIQIHRVNPSTNSRSNLLQAGDGRNVWAFGVSAFGVSAFGVRRIGTRGAVGLRSRATGVARPEPVSPRIELRRFSISCSHVPWTCNAGRAGARSLPRHARGHRHAPVIYFFGNAA